MFVSAFQGKQFSVGSQLKKVLDPACLEGYILWSSLVSRWASIHLPSQTSAASPICLWNLWLHYGPYLIKVIGDFHPETHAFERADKLRLYHLVADTESDTESVIGTISILKKPCGRY